MAVKILKDKPMYFAQGLYEIGMLGLVCRATGWLTLADVAFGTFPLLHHWI